MKLITNRPDVATECDECRESADAFVLMYDCRALICLACIDKAHRLFGEMKPEPVYE